MCVLFLNLLLKVWCFFYLLQPTWDGLHPTSDGLQPKSKLCSIVCLFCRSCWVKPFHTRLPQAPIVMQAAKASFSSAVVGYMLRNKDSLQCAIGRSARLHGLFARLDWSLETGTQGTFCFTRNKNATRNKCIATSNRCLTSSNKKLLVTSASLVVTRWVTGRPVSHLSGTSPWDPWPQMSGPWPRGLLSSAIVPVGRGRQNQTPTSLHSTSLIPTEGTRVSPCVCLSRPPKKRMPPTWKPSVRALRGVDKLCSFSRTRVAF